MSNSLRSVESPDASAGARRELARRTSGGIDVTLYWNPILDELIVRVCDERQRAYFEIRPQRYLALDAYYHPYAYADRADVHEKESRLAA